MKICLKRENIQTGVTFEMQINTLTFQFLLLSSESRYHQYISLLEPSHRRVQAHTTSNHRTGALTLHGPIWLGFTISPGGTPGPVRSSVLTEHLPLLEPLQLWATTSPVQSLRQQGNLLFHVPGSSDTPELLNTVAQWCHHIPEFFLHIFALPLSCYSSWCLTQKYYPSGKKRGFSCSIVISQRAPTPSRLIGQKLVHTPYNQAKIWFKI